MASRTESRRPARRRPPGGGRPVGRAIQCTATNGGATASAACDSGAKGDAKACMAEVKDLVNLKA